MTVHMSLRLAWHSDGWNGHICSNPAANTYCVGQYSYPGDAIAKTRDLEWEKINCGKAICKLNKGPACAFSANAFGKDTIIAHSEPPDWFGDKARGVDISIPPMTACTWYYEGMYAKGVTESALPGRTYNSDKRYENTQNYFAQFENNKSLIFYYAPYSNPFSEAEQRKFVVVGVSRLKNIGGYYYYDNVSPKIRELYGGGLVWQRPITSCYPDEGFRIPYNEYINNEDVLDKILFVPENAAPFKYGSREVSDDDAISLIDKFIEIVDILIDMEDSSENWKIRKEWLSSVLAELWQERGPLPGYIKVLEKLGLGGDIKIYLDGDYKFKKTFRDNVAMFLHGESNYLPQSTYSAQELIKVRRNYQLCSGVEQKALLELFPRFDLTPTQINNIIADNRTDFSISASLDEIMNNPYIICEQYVGTDVYDSIPFYRIDNGILPSPDFGLSDLFPRDSAERLRALCVSELNKIPAHTFASAVSILDSINRKLNAMPVWKRHQYIIRNFSVDRDILSKALYIKVHNSNDIYLYLLRVYKDERVICETLRSLAERNEITLKIPVTQETFEKELYTDTELLESYPCEYSDAIKSQASTCRQIFTKPISIISGAAGTGKTTIIRAIIKNIERTQGIGSGIILMAPTGKATERIKNQTGRPSTTIHSFLAKRGWININLTLKQSGGQKGEEAGTIIIDECSMVDLSLFATLVRAVNWNSVQRLILVGDPNQLPPIGRGKVFSDAIEWLKKEYPQSVGVLTYNLRQLSNKISQKGTGILDLAQLFIQENQRETQKLKNDKELVFSRVQYGGDVDKDLHIIYWNTIDELENNMSNSMLHDMEEATGDFKKEGKEYLLWDKACKGDQQVRRASYMQVITPYRGEPYGTEHINAFLQRLLNGGWVKKFTLDGLTIADKVIQYRNRPQSNPAFAYNEKTKTNEKAEIYNGEIGFVRPHKLDEKDKKYNSLKRLTRFQVAFSGENRLGLMYYYGKELGKFRGCDILAQSPSENLELAYAISAHKSQGSEFDNVYVIIPNRNSHLLSMELIYTAITRAQKRVTLLIQNDISTLVSMSRVEKSATQRINSSIFTFKPLPQEIIYMNDWYQEGKIVSTLSEYLVRSKSEMNIVNILTLKGIEFLYERPLFAPDGTMFLPDFTLFWHGEEYYWEHVGCLDIPEYKKHWETKKQWYEKHFPGKLITTFEGPKQTKEIEDIINTFFI